MPYEEIYQYQSKCIQEEVDKQVMLDFIKRNKDSLYRTNKVAHFTSSAFILNKSLTKVLYVNHLIYKSWGWVGGHNDGEKSFLNVAIKEAKEETGLTILKPISKKPLMLDIIHVTNHIKNGKYVSDHLHFNLTFFLIADEKEKLIINQKETKGVKWFEVDEMLSLIKEERMHYIYNKAYNIIKNIKNKGLDYYDNISK